MPSPIIHHQLLQSRKLPPTSQANPAPHLGNIVELALMAKAWINQLLKVRMGRLVQHLMGYRTWESGFWPLTGKALVE